MKTILLSEPQSRFIIKKGFPLRLLQKHVVNHDRDYGIMVYQILS